MDKFVERSQLKPSKGRERRSSGPTLLEPAASGASAAGESAAPRLLEERAHLTTATAQGGQARLSPWWAVSQAKERPGYFLAKRCLDFSLALLVVLLLAPLFLLLVLLVRLTSRGPAFFRQERVGFGGRHFKMYKFRSMYVDSDESLHRKAYEQFLRGERSTGKVSGGIAAVKQGDQPQGSANATSATPRRKSFRHSSDPRITPLGYLLRRSSLDELPQLFNVLRGEMSLVGPRPPIPYEVGLYQSWHLGRLDTLPGITGFWQVYGRGRVSFDRMVQMDLDYIQKQSFWYDLKLLLLTLPVVLSRKGAS